NGGGNLIEANFIGTDVTGTAAADASSPTVPNTHWGIVITNSPGNLIGGTDAGAGNLISGIRGTGIYVSGSQSINNVIQGNWIGTDVTGVAPLGNQYYGIHLGVDSASTQVGGTTTGSANTI